MRLFPLSMNSLYSVLDRFIDFEKQVFQILYISYGG